MAAQLICVNAVAYRHHVQSTIETKRRSKPMVKLIAAAAFALAVSTSAQAMSPAPLHQPDGVTTQVAYGCGAGSTRVGGVCVARTT